MLPAVFRADSMQSNYPLESVLIQNLLEQEFPLKLFRSIRLVLSRRLLAVMKLNAWLRRCRVVRLLVSILLPTSLYLPVATRP